MSLSEPRLTVLMPVYNGDPFLHDAIASILGQTFGDYELLIINDGSTDNSVKTVASFSDPRIRIVHHPHNLGLIATLNQGFDLAKGEFIARMDSDDLSLPERMVKQVIFMERHPQVGACGTWFEDMKTSRIIERPTSHQAIMQFMIDYGCPLAHPSVILRKSILHQHHLYYDPDYQHAEDFELWTRLAQVAALANLPEVLLRHRSHSGQVSQIFAQLQETNTKRILKRLRNT